MVSGNLMEWVINIDPSDPTDMLAGRRGEILGRRREMKDRTINRRILSNHALREQFAPA